MATQAVSNALDPNPPRPVEDARRELAHHYLLQSSLPAAGARCAGRRRKIGGMDPETPTNAEDQPTT